MIYKQLKHFRRNHLKKDSHSVLFNIFSPDIIIPIVENK